MPRLQPFLWDSEGQVRYYILAVCSGSAPGSPSSWTCPECIHKKEPGRHPDLMWNHLKWLNAKTVNPSPIRPSISRSISSTLVCMTLRNLNNSSLGPDPDIPKLKGASHHSPAQYHGLRHEGAESDVLINHYHRLAAFAINPMATL